ncbi:MAG: pyridoxal phosphate-dependent aminotransferase, partial [Synergistes sp.]|nr:pyridoxal phosphate-dependent aminotransferase [Synergistes sp.]
PLCAKEAAIKALNEGFVHYTDMSGTKVLRDAIADKYRRENNMNFVNADKNIVVTCGAMEALMTAMLGALDPGDEIIVPSPYFSAYFDLTSIAQVKIVSVATKMEDDFRLDVEALKKAYTPKTKAILLNSPNNPSGAVLTRKNLEEIAEFAKEADLLVISDECYEKFLYVGEHASIASLPGMEERTITISSASKTWSMTGWRVGWLVCPAAMTPYLCKCHQNITSCVNSFAQIGVAEAFAKADKDVAAMIAEYKRRRDMVVKWLNSIDGIEASAPQGAFYAFPKISSLGMDGFKFCTWLLEEKGVSTVPGEVFNMPGHIRIAYCREYDYIEEGMKRIKEAVENLKK